MENKKRHSERVSYSNFFPHVNRQRRISHQNKIKSNCPGIPLRQSSKEMVDNDCENSLVIPYKTRTEMSGRGAVKQEMEDNGTMKTSSGPYFLTNMTDIDKGSEKTESSPEKSASNSLPIDQQFFVKKSSSTKKGVLNKNPELGRVDSNQTQTAGLHCSSDLCPSTVTDLLMDQNANKEFDLISHILEESSEESSPVRKPSKVNFTRGERGMSPRLYEENSVTEFDSVSNVGRSIDSEQKTTPSFRPVFEEDLINASESWRNNFEYPYSQKDFQGKGEGGRKEQRSEKMRPYHLQNMSAFKGKRERSHTPTHKRRYMLQNPDPNDFEEYYYNRRQSVPSDVGQRLSNPYPRDLHPPLSAGLNTVSARGLGDETSGYISESYLSNCRRLSGSDNTIAYNRKRDVYKHTEPEDTYNHSQQNIHHFTDQQCLNVSPTFQTYPEEEHTRIVDRRSIDRCHHGYLQGRRQTDSIKSPSRKSLYLPSAKHLEMNKRAISANSSNIMDDGCPRQVIVSREDMEKSGRESAPLPSAYPPILCTGFGDSYSQGRMSAPPPRVHPDEMEGLMPSRSHVFGRYHTSDSSRNSKQVIGSRSDINFKTRHSYEQAVNFTSCKSRLQGDSQLDIIDPKRGISYSGSRIPLYRTRQPCDSKRVESSQRFMRDLSCQSWNNTSEQFTNERENWIENPSEDDVVASEGPSREMRKSMSQQRIIYSPKKHNCHRFPLNERYCERDNRHETKLHSHRGKGIRISNPPNVTETKRIVKNTKKGMSCRKEFEKGTISKQSGNNQNIVTMDVEGTQLTRKQVDENIDHDSVMHVFDDDDDNSLHGQDQDQQVNHGKIKFNRYNLGTSEEIEKNVLEHTNGSLISQKTILRTPPKVSHKTPKKTKHVESKDRFRTPTKTKRHSLQTGWDEDNDDDFMDSPLKPLEEYPFPQKRLMSKKALKRPSTYQIPQDISLSTTNSSWSVVEKRKKLGRLSNDPIRKEQLPLLDKGHEDFWETPLKETEDCVGSVDVPDNPKQVYHPPCKKRKVNDDVSDDELICLSTSSEVSSIITNMQPHLGSLKITTDHENSIQINEDPNLLNNKYGQSTCLYAKDSSEPVESMIEEESNSKDLKASKTKLSQGKVSGKGKKEMSQENKKSELKNQCQDQNEISKTIKGLSMKSSQSTNPKEKSQANEKGEINNGGSTDQVENSKINEKSEDGTRKKSKKRKQTFSAYRYNLRKNSLNTSTEGTEDSLGFKKNQENNVKNKKLARKSQMKKVPLPAKRGSGISGSKKVITLGNKSDSVGGNKSLKNQQGSCEHESSKVESEIINMNESQLSTTDCDIDYVNLDDCQNNHENDGILEQTKENQKTDKLKIISHENILKPEKTNKYPDIKINSQEEEKKESEKISTLNTKSDSSFPSEAIRETPVEPVNQDVSVAPQASTDDMATSPETISEISSSDTNASSGALYRSNADLPALQLPLMTSTDSQATNNVQAIMCTTVSNVGTSPTSVAKSSHALEAFPLKIEGLFINGRTGLQLVGWKPLSNVTGNMLMAADSTGFIGSSFNSTSLQIAQPLPISKGSGHPSTKTLRSVNLAQPQPESQKVLQAFISPTNTIYNKNQSTMTKPLVNSVMHTPQTTAQVDKNHLFNSQGNMSRPIVNETPEKISGTNNIMSSRLPEKTGYRKNKTRLEGFVSNGPVQPTSIQYLKPLSTYSVGSVTDCNRKPIISNRHIECPEQQGQDQKDQMTNSDLCLKPNDSSFLINQVPSDSLINQTVRQTSSISELTNPPNSTQAKTRLPQRPIRNTGVQTTSGKLASGRNLKDILQSTAITSPVLKTANPKTLTANIRIQTPNNAVSSQVLLIPVFKISPVVQKPSAVSVTGSKELSGTTSAKCHSDASPPFLYVSSPDTNSASSSKILFTSEAETFNNAEIISPFQPECNTNTCAALSCLSAENSFTSLPTSHQSSLIKMGNPAVKLSTDTTVSPSNCQLQLSTRESLKSNQHHQANISTELFGESGILPLSPCQSEENCLTTLPREIQDPKVQIFPDGPTKNSELSDPESLLSVKGISGRNCSTSNPISNNTTMDIESSNPHHNLVKESFNESFESVFSEELPAYSTPYNVLSKASQPSNSSTLLCEKYQKPFPPNNINQQPEGSSDPCCVPAPDSEEEIDTCPTENTLPSTIHADSSYVRNNWAEEGGSDRFQSEHLEIIAKDTNRKVRSKMDKIPDQELPTPICIDSPKCRSEKNQSESVAKEDGTYLNDSPKPVKTEPSSFVVTNKATNLKSSKRIRPSRKELYRNACPKWNFRSRTMKAKHKRFLNSFVSLSNEEIDENIKFRNLRSGCVQTVFNYKCRPYRRISGERKDNMQTELPQNTPKVSQDKISQDVAGDKLSNSMKSSVDKDIWNKSVANCPKRRRKRRRRSCSQIKKCNGDSFTVGTTGGSQNLPTNTENSKKQLDCLPEDNTASSTTLKENVPSHPTMISHVDIGEIQNADNPKSVDEVKFSNNKNLEDVYSLINEHSNYDLDKHTRDNQQQVKKLKGQAEKEDSFQDTEEATSIPKRFVSQADNAAQQPVDSTEPENDCSEQSQTYTQQAATYQQRRDSTSTEYQHEDQQLTLHQDRKDKQPPSPSLQLLNITGEGAFKAISEQTVAREINTDVDNYQTFGSLDSIAIPLQQLSSDVSGIIGTNTSIPEDQFSVDVPVNSNSMTKDAATYSTDQVLLYHSTSLDKEFSDMTFTMLNSDEIPLGDECPHLFSNNEDILDTNRDVFDSVLNPKRLTSNVDSDKNASSIVEAESTMNRNENQNCRLSQESVKNQEQASKSYVSSVQKNEGQKMGSVAETSSDIENCMKNMLDVLLDQFEDTETNIEILPNKFDDGSPRKQEVAVMMSKSDITSPFPFEFENRNTSPIQGNTWCVSSTFVYGSETNFVQQNNKITFGQEKETCLPFNDKNLSGNDKSLHSYVLISDEDCDDSFFKKTDLFYNKREENILPIDKSSNGEALIPSHSKEVDLIAFMSPDTDTCLAENDKGDWTDEIISPVSEIKHGMEFSLIPVKNRTKKPKLVITCGKCGRTFQRHYTFEKHKAAHIRKEMKDTSMSDWSRSFSGTPVDGCESSILETEDTKRQQIPAAKKSRISQKKRGWNPVERRQTRQRGKSAPAIMGKDGKVDANRDKKPTKETSRRRQTLPLRKADGVTLQATCRRKSFPTKKGQCSRKRKTSTPIKRKLSSNGRVQRPSSIRNGKNSTHLSVYTKEHSPEQAIYYSDDSPKNPCLNKKIRTKMTVDSESQTEDEGTLLTIENNKDQKEVEEAGRILLDGKNLTETGGTENFLVSVESQTEMDETESEIDPDSEINSRRRRIGNQVVWQCKYCERHFPRKYRYNRHLCSEHIDEDWKKIQCWFCKSWFPWEFRLAFHIIMMHKDEIEKEMGNYPCNSCDSTFKNFGHLYSHYQLKHSNKFKLVIREVVPNVTQMVPVHACKVCGEFRFQIEELKAHVCHIQNSFKNSYAQVEILRKNQSYMFCLYCSSKFCSVEDTNVHIRASHLSLVQRLESRMNYLCLFCQKVLWSGYEMKKHVGANHSLEEKMMNVESRLEDIAQSYIE